MKNSKENIRRYFAENIDSYSEIKIDNEIMKPNKFLLDFNNDINKNINIVYAPFDFINREAKIVIVGITPGKTQMRNAILEFRNQILKGENLEVALLAAKKFASFSGPMRVNLVRILDIIGVNGLLNIKSTESLWNCDARLVNFTSILKYPTFIDGKNYNGSPSMINNLFLREQICEYFFEELKLLPNAIFVPLGPVVSEALVWATGKIGINSEQILSGLPHPSGANAERIAYFLGLKAKADLSRKTNPDKLDEGRQILTEKIARLRQKSTERS